MLEGSGFVVAPNRVMSTASVVAGAETVTVEANGQTFDATVVSYDPNADISILDVPNLPSPPLQFNMQQASTGTDAIALGYPGGGDFAATPARIREVIELQRPDMYHTATVTRQMYTIRGTVRLGNSGGPLIDRSGKILGVVWGESAGGTDDSLALTANEVASQMGRVGNTRPVSTGSCSSQTTGAGPLVQPLPQVPGWGGPVAGKYVPAP